ncbi:MAG: TonB family protein [Patescibacteria group bacterium]
MERKDLFGSVSTDRPKSKARSAVAFSVAVLVNFVAVATLVISPLLATNELPLIHRDSPYVMRADIVLPTEPSAPKKTESVPKDPNAPNPKGAPPESPDKISPEPPRVPEWTPPTAPCPGCLPPTGGPEGPPTLGPPPPPTPPKPEPPPPPTKPVRISSSEMPRQVVRVNPTYPTIAQSARVEGVVIIEAIIDRFGNVVNANILRGQALLNEAALSAVRQWKYEPHKLNGEPVPIIMTVTVTFSLK